MDAFSDPTVEMVVVKSSAQVGKTEILNNVVGYYIDQDPAPILVVQPTLEMGHAWSKDRLAPMLRDTPALKGKVKEPRSRDSGNTLRHKVFPGGHLTISGANSSASLASRPIRVVLCDEIDRFSPSAGSEGDPVSLAWKRATTFWNRKLGLFSTPTIKGASRIDSAYEESDQRRFYVPCPDCGHFQHLKFAQVRWDKDDIDSGVYVCENCGSCWDDVARWKAVNKGEWRATAEFNGVAGFHLGVWCSPWVTVKEVIARFLEAKKFPERLQVVVNTDFGEVWEDQGETVDEAGLLERREPYGPEVPPGVGLLTAGVDVQDDRIEVTVNGWGKDEESWVIDHQVIYGDPSAPAVWEDLDQYLLKQWPAALGQTMRLQAVAVDTGGHYTQMAYDFCRPRYRRRVWAIKGVSGPGKPVWNRKPSRNNIGKVHLWLVNGDAGKEVLYARLRSVTEPGPGYCHFSLDRGPEYFKQLTAEKVVTKYHKGQPRREWTKPDQARNEALDCWVYSYAALHSLIAGGLDLNLTARMARPKAGPGASAPVASPGRRVRSKGIHG